MNKELLQARIQQITLEMENARSQLTALQFHLNESTYWLAEHDKKEAAYALDLIPINEPISEPISEPINEPI